MNLQILGLNAYESKTYQSLVELGKSTGAKIAEQSGVPYGRIYDTLASLQHKKLVSIIPAKTKEYVAANPKEVQEILKQKQKELESLNEELSNLSKKYSEKVKQPIIMGTGKGAFMKLLNQKPTPKKFEYAVKYSSDIKPQFLRDVEINIKKGVDTKILTRDCKETRENIEEWQKVTKNIKSINNQGVAMSITETHVLISFINSNSTLLIEDESFSKMMRDLFLSRFNKK